MERDRLAPPRSPVPIGPIAVLVLGAIGLGTSGLLLFDYLAESSGVCGAGGGCDQVRHSSYAQFGGIPTPAFGVIFFAGLIGAVALGRRARGSLPWLAGAGAAVGVALLAVQAFVLDAFCGFCVVVDVSAVLAFAAVIGAPGARELGRRGRAFGVAAALVVGGAVALVGLPRHDAAAEVPDGVELLAELPEPVAREQREDVITIVEFLDFECPHCARLHHELEVALDGFGPRTRVVRKYTPFTGRQAALPAALAAVCAEMDGLGDEMADALFAAPDRSPAALERIARDLRLDADRHRACVTSREAVEVIARDVADAEAAEVSSLPTIFIDRERLVGARSAEVLRASLERAAARGAGAPRPN